MVYQPSTSSECVRIMLFRMSWILGFLFFDSAYSALVYRHGPGGVVQIREVESFDSELSAEGWSPLDDPLQSFSNPILQRLARTSLPPAASVSPDSDGASIAAAVPEVPEQDEAEEDEAEVPWTMVEIVPLVCQDPTSAIQKHALLETAHKYCEQKKIPMITWKRGRLCKSFSYTGHCGYHLSGPDNLRKPLRRRCPFKYRMRAATADDLAGTPHEGENPKDFAVLESRLQHEGEPDPAHAMKELIAKYAKLTPRAAEKQMTKDQVEHRGEYYAKLEKARYAARHIEKDGKRYDGTFVATLRAFCANPKAPVTCVLNDADLVVNADVTRIVFYHDAFLREGIQRLLKDRVARIVVDGTYKTNVQRLVLVGLGGLYLVNENGHIHNRWVPWMFCLSDSEDEEAYTAVVQQFLAFGRTNFEIDLAPMIQDAYVDGMGGAHNALEAVLPDCVIHRDLQHIRANLVKQMKSKLNRHDYWATYLENLLLFSAKLNTRAEFQAVWKTVLGWMDTVFEEPEMAEYLRETVLVQGADGDFHCKWRHGLDSVPLGYTTFVSNNIERGWRTVKGLLPSGYQVQDCAQTMVEVCEILASRVDHVMYRNLAVHGFPAVPSYFKSVEKRRSGRLMDEQQPRRLTVERLLAAGQMYLVEDAKFDLIVNRVAKPVVRVYIIPKYRVEWAIETPEAMEKLLRLVLSPDSDAWLHTFGGYDVDAHRRLFERFCVVYVFADGTVLDGHPDFLKETQSEHAHFAHGLEHSEELQKTKEGPESRRPARVAKPDKRPEGMRELLRRATEETALPILSLPAPASMSSVAPGADAPAADSEPSAPAGEGAAAAAVAGAGPPDEENLCMARTWNCGAGGRCKRPRSSGSDLCIQHEKNLKHGRLDDPPTEELRRKMAKTARKASTATSSGKPQESTADAGTSAVAGGIASSADDVSLLPAGPAASSGVVSSGGSSSGALSSGQVWMQPASLGGRARSASLLQRKPANPLQSTLQQWRRAERPTGDLAASWSRSIRFHMDQWLLRRGMEESSLGDEAKQAHDLRQQEFMEGRLLSLGLERLPVAKDGNCQFVAMCRAMGFPDEGHQQLRQEALLTPTTCTQGV